MQLIFFCEEPLIDLIQENDTYKKLIENGGINMKKLLGHILNLL